MKRKTAVIVLQSTAPTLVNPMLEKTLTDIGGKTASGPRRNDVQDRDVAKIKRYTNADGKMGWPALNLAASLCEAGKHVSVKFGNAKKTAALTKSTGRSIIPTIVKFPSPFYAFEGLNENGEILWEADGRRTVNPATGGSNRTIRPLIPSWKCKVTFTYTDQFEDNTMLELWKMAGERAGLGDGRPSAPNKPLPIPHGTFRVESFTVMEEAEIIDNVEVQFAPELQVKHAAGNGSNGRGNTLVVPAPVGV